MLERLSRFSIKHPVLVIVLFVIITVFFAFQIPGVEIDTAIKSQIPEKMASRVNIKRIEEIFGGTDIVLLTISTDKSILEENTLNRIKRITGRLANEKGVDRVNSIFNVPDIRGEDDQLIIEDTVEEIPVNQQQRQEIKERIINNELIYKSLVAEDFKSTAIAIVLDENVKDDEIISEIKGIIKEIPGNEEVLYAGLPIIRGVLDDYMAKDMRRFLPLGLLIMIIFLYFCFRQFRGIILPFSVVVMSIIVAAGSISLLGWKIQLITIILPVILLAIANDYGIHIIARYQEENRVNFDLSKRELTSRITEGLRSPILAAGLTTIIGLLCLKAHIIVPAKQLGVLASIGIGFAILASLMFIPAVLTLLPKTRPAAAKENHFLDRLLQRSAELIISRPVTLIVISLIIIIGIGTGIFRLVVDTDPIKYYPRDNPVRRASELANEKFGGSYNISLVAEGDMKDPVNIKKIEQMVNWLEGDKYIDNVVAISKPLSKMNEVLHNGNQEYYRVPDSRGAIAQYLMLYSMSADLDKMLDFNYQHSLVTARIASNSTDTIKRIVGKIKNYLNQQQDSPFIIVGGFADLLSELADSVVKGQLYSLFLSLLIVTLVVMILFSSITAGLLAAVPLLIAITTLFGLMGHFEIELNMVTALLSSIMIGAGIDYTIHFLWRYREELKSNTPDRAVKQTLTTSGRGIVFNALSVIVGFVVMLASNFLPIKFFGFLVIVSITTCLVGALVILPAVCLALKPAFLTGNKLKSNKEKGISNYEN